jgi:colanic acid/amylovoran biosynthesis glycosyltransferase
MRWRRVRTRGLLACLVLPASSSASVAEHTVGQRRGITAARARRGIPPVQSLVDPGENAIKTPLAVIAPDIGMRSETFIGKHMTELLPGRTASIGRLERPAGPPPDWLPGAPILDLASGLSGGRELRWRAARVALRRAGLQPEAIPVARFLRRHRVEALLGEYLDTSARWVPLARRLDVRVFAHAHGVDASAHIREERWRATCRTLNEADGVIAVSIAMRDRLVRAGVGPDKIHVVPYGVEVPDTPASRLAGDVVRCLAVGRMVPKKGPVYLLAAFRRALTRVPNLTLDYVGDGELLPAVRQFVSAMELGHQVVLHGSLPHAAVRRLMLDADLFVQHSLEDPETGDAEGLPVAVLEAMASALPIVATRHEGIVEAIPDDTVGLLVDEGDTAAMAAYIAELADDPASRARIGRAAWGRARERFTWERERAELLALLALTDRASGGTEDDSRDPPVAPA